MKGGGDIPVPTPIVAHDLIFITNAHGSMSPVYAIRPTATGDISLAADARSNEHVAWAVERGGAYMQTPLVHGDLLYVCRDNGVLTVYEARSGTQVYQQRLGGGSSGFTASPVAAGDHVYFTSEVGDVYVVRAGRTFTLAGTPALDEIAMATPAVADGTLYFRTRGHVVAVGATPAR
jgi:outer membrane protein assembly factor BamB